MDDLYCSQNDLYNFVFFNNDDFPVEPETSDQYRGTPDRITKAGCLALAYESNRCKNVEIWNSWRRNFPSRIICQNPISYENNANFNNCDFEKNKAIDFSNFEFGNGVNFEGTKFGDRVSFENATFNDSSNFRNCNFGNITTFEGVKFSRAVYFCGSKFGEFLNFDRAEFHLSVAFNNVTFNSCTMFHNCKFKIADFQNSEFNGSVSFDNSSFSYLNFNGTRCKGHFRLGKGLIHNDAIFEGVIFENSANFSGRIFGGRTSFGKMSSISSNLGKNKEVITTEVSILDESTNFAYVPNFHGAQLNQDTLFEGAKFPPFCGKIEAIHAYRALKLAFSAHQATREEQFFFRNEMAEEALFSSVILSCEKGVFTFSRSWLKNIFKKKNTINKLNMLNLFRPPRIYYMAYNNFSGYGFSVARPAFLLIMFPLLVMNILSGFIAYSAGWQQWLPWSGIRWTFNWNEIYHFIQFCVSGALPMLDIKNEVLLKQLNILFGNVENISYILLSIISGFQKILAILGWFLIGLALRNNFKIK